MKKLTATVALLLMAPALASAQNADNPSRAEGYCFVAPIVVGPPTVVVNRGGFSFGFGGDVFIYKGLGVGAEAAYAGGPYRTKVGTGALDGSYHFLSKINRRKVEPFAVGGYSTYFGNRGAASGFNLGGGVNYWAAKHFAFRFEVRENAHIGPDQFYDIRNFVGFRFGLTFR